MKSAKRTQTVYTADDGKEFLDEVECRKYETEVIERVAKMKFFRVMHCPDLTEGRGRQKATLVAVDVSYCHELAVTDWCERNLGSRVGYVMGCGPTPSWSIHDSDKKRWDSPVGVTWGGRSSPPNKILIAETPVPTVEPDEHLVWQSGSGGGFKKYGEKDDAGD